MAIRDHAHRLALEHIEPDVRRGFDVRYIQSTFHGAGGPTYSVVVKPGFLVHVSRVNGQDCDELFSLRKLFKEAKQQQLSLF